MITGEAPFELDKGWEPNMLENAGAFAVGILADWYMFSNPLTGGPALTVRLATKEAQKRAAGTFAKHIFGNELSKKITKEGLEEGFEGLTKTGIAKAFASKNSDDVFSAKQYLVKNSRVKDTPQLQSLFDEALKKSEKQVANSLRTPNFFKEGLILKSNSKYGLEAGQQLLPKPTMQRIIASFGSQSAKALGMYSTVQNVEMQMRDNLLSEYGPKGPEAWDRWKETGVFDDTFGRVDDWTQVLYSAAHGYLGGYVAGGLSGLRFMGMAGALSGKASKAEKWLDTKFPAVGDKLYEGWKSNVGWVLAEGVGFTAAGRVTDIAARTMGMDVPEHSLGEALLQNIATIGMTKIVHKGWKESWQKMKYPVDELNSYFDRKTVELGIRKGKLKASIDADKTNEAQNELIHKGVNEVLDVEISRNKTKERELNTALDTFEALWKKMQVN